uniref:Uncharacterized protein n=1 Tax=Ditylum brightwellii TaxID=49249 RepID=A0A7S4V459_9STRA
MNEPSSEPSIVDFIEAIGEKNSITGRNNIKQHINRNVLRLYTQWANAVTAQRRQSMCIYKLDLLNENIEQFMATFSGTLSPYCALLEVNAISLLSSLEASNRQSSTTGIVYNSHNEVDDDDDMSAELANLEDSTRILQKELESVERRPSSFQQQRAAVSPRRISRNKMSSSKGGRRQVGRSMTLVDTTNVRRNNQVHDFLHHKLKEIESVSSKEGRGKENSVTLVAFGRHFKISEETARCVNFYNTK